MRFRRVAAPAAALALSIPGASFAQSAGDDQYRDPFGEDNQQQGQGSGDAGETAPDTGGQSAPAPAPSPAPAPAPSTGTEPTATVAGELPRTGLGAGLVAALGVVLLAAGIGLRRGTEPF